MSRAAQAGLWTAALAGSLALHGLIATALLAMPVPAADKAPPTEINFEAIDSATLTPQAPAAVVPVAVDRIAPVAPSAINAVAPVATAEAIAAHDDIQPIESNEPNAAIEAVKPTTGEATAPVPATTALASVDDATPAVAEAADRDVLAPAPETGLDMASLAPDLQAPVTDHALTVMTAEPVPAAQAQASIISAERADDTRDAPLAQEALSAPVVERPTPSIAQTAQVPVVAPQVTSPTMPTAAVPVAPAMAPAVGAPAKPVAEAAQGAPRVALPPQTALPLAPVAETNGSAVGGAEQGETQVAMLPPQPAVGETSPGAEPVKLADFLKSYEGGDCMLAIPTDTARVETLSDAADSVYAMGRAFRRQSGIPVKTDRQTVSKAQCGTLAFSRSLAQYPNYPLKLDLDARTIGSGRPLSGHVSGLRKPTLYLFIVDDEGKAKLIEALANETKTTVGFSVALTLTDGAADSVQLLVAVASDEPLKTVATKAGVEATSFFASLTDEIQKGNKPIHYGITSFVVR